MIWIVFVIFLIVRGYDCLYFGHGNSNKLLLLWWWPTSSKGPTTLTNVQSSQNHGKRARLGNFAIYTEGIDIGPSFHDRGCCGRWVADGPALACCWCDGEEDGVGSRNGFDGTARRVGGSVTRVTCTDITLHHRYVALVVPRCRFLVLGIDH